MIDDDYAPPPPPARRKPKAAATAPAATAATVTAATVTDAAAAGTRTDNPATHGPAPGRAAAAAKAAHNGKPHTLGHRFADPDLVDRIFDYVVELLPEIAAHRAEVTFAVRAEFAGERAYVSRLGVDLPARVLAAFNGRNATEVARTLRISRATVYRILKQPGGR